nr:PREDICTED: putative MYST-like histone acetyltransferase 1 isoform X3 [Musa acuminata subsp. malaccensis]
MVIERRKIPNDYEYYVHYTDHFFPVNRRLDERVKLEQLDLGTMETDLYEKVEDKVTSLKMTRRQKRKIDETHVEHGDEELDASSLQEHEEFTKVKNIAKIELGRYKIDTWKAVDNDIW